MIHIENKADCCGCNACGDICAHNAITFKTDIEGFWYPEVNPELCTDCHLCEKVCPIINIDKLKKNDFQEPICYAAEHKNLEVVFDSTSGGLFSALAEMMYKDSGYVGGAVFNDDFSVRHYISNDKANLPKLRSSKYLESNLEGFFKQVKALLSAGEKVLVCGCPCQMAALRAFLMHKDYENLIIADFVCRGINSPKVWRKYLDSFEERYGSKVASCKAKSKEYGWRKLTQKVILEDGRHIYETRDQSNFTKGYIQTGAYCRPSCYDCKFKGYPRISDISLADFWGIEKVNKSMEKDLGTSLVLINSQKGEAFFERIKGKINSIPVELKDVEGGNPALKYSLDKPKVNRDEFFADLDKMTFTQIAEKYILSPNHPGSHASQVKGMLRKTYHSMKFWKSALFEMGYKPSVIWQFLKINTLKGIRNRNMIIPTPHTVLQFEKGSNIVVNGIVRIGVKKCHKSKLETRIFVDKGGTLAFNGSTTIMYGADIEVFENAKLSFGGGGISNMGLTIICGNRIEIGKDVMMGRHITIRDNNGSHYMNRQGYKNSAPVIIGDKAWLCESATIMQGVKVGAGGIVGAQSLVLRKVPDHALVSGHPAEIVDEDILWKY